MLWEAVKNRMARGRIRNRSRKIIIHLHVRIILLLMELKANATTGSSQSLYAISFHIKLQLLYHFYLCWISNACVNVTGSNAQLCFVLLTQRGKAALILTYGTRRLLLSWAHCPTFWLPSMRSAARQPESQLFRVWLRTEKNNYCQGDIMVDSMCFFKDTYSERACCRNKTCTESTRQRQ